MQREAPRTPTIYRDVTKVPLKQLEAELATLTKSLAKVNPKSARGKELIESRDIVRRELERRGAAPRVAAARSKLNLLERQIGAGLDSIKFTYRLGAEHYLGTVEKRLAGFDERNRRAYAKVEKILAEAEADEKRFHKIRDTVLGVVIGAGVGLAADKIWDGAKGLAKVVWELAGETASWGVGEAVEATLLRPGAEWSIPPAMNPDKVALAETAKLLGAWKGLALTNASAVTAGDVLRRILWARRLLEGDVTDRSMSFVDSYLASEQAADIGMQLIQASLSQRTAMAAFEAGAEYRLARSEHRLEQDMWLAWIRTGPDGDAIRRVVDHLQDEALLIAIGGRADLVGDRGHPSDRSSRIEGLGKAARDDGILMRYLDQLGVVVKSSGKSGVIRLRHDAYRGATELDPDPGGPEPYFSARSMTSSMPSAGQVAKVADVYQGDLVVSSVFVRGGTKSVAPDEITAGELIVATNKRAR